MQGVLRLQKQYSQEKINWACEQATKIGSIRYHTVKLMCQDNDPNTDESMGQLNLLQHHEIIRGAEEYQQYMESSQTSNVTNKT